MFQTKLLRSQKTHFIVDIFVHPKFCHLRDNVEKCVRAQQTTDNIIRGREDALCMKDN
jgi:hypothetical protein